MILRDYQEEGILHLRHEIALGIKKIILASPCGSGKSWVLAQIIANALEKGKKVLWLVHRRNLVLQFRETLEEFGVDAGVIMAGIEPDTSRPCQICTLQTYSRRIDLDSFITNKFFIDADLILIDEAHRSISKTYQSIIDLYEDKVIIGVTATPARADGRGMGEVYDSIIDVVGVQKLIDREYLSKVRYFSVTEPDLTGVKVAMGDYVVKQLNDKMNKTQLNGDVVENWLKNSEDRETICFGVNVKHSIALCDEFNRRGVKAEHLDARSSDEIRDDVFKRMEHGDTKVICNVGLYQEGLDVPAVSCIIMARPTKSMGLYRQCCGRGLRVFPGKKDCIIFDHGGVIAEHGFLEDPIEWSLDGKKVAWKKPKTQDSEIRMVTCRACKEVFKAAKVCPTCGTELKTFGKSIETTDDALVELKGRRTKNKNMPWDEKRQLMGALVWHSRKKGYRDGWAAHSYKSYFGVWPNDPRVKNVFPIEPKGEIKNILTHILIKKAAQYKKLQAAHGN